MGVMWVPPWVPWWELYSSTTYYLAWEPWWEPWCVEVLPTAPYCSLLLRDKAYSWASGSTWFRGYGYRPLVRCVFVAGVVVVVVSGAEVSWGKGEGIRPGGAQLAGW